MDVSTCAHCGRTFAPSKSQQVKARKNPNKRLFCSRECFIEHTRGKRITFQCEVCGKQVTDYASNRPQARYCSWACAAKAHTKRKRVPAQCVQCGKTIIKKTAAKRPFCSLECYWIWKREHPAEVAPPSQRVRKRCEVCGGEFEAHRYRADKAQFCSARCMHEARRKYPVDPGFSPRLCACGCGAIIRPMPWHKYTGMPRFARGHGSINPKRLPYRTPFQGVKYMRSGWEVDYARWLDAIGEPWYYEHRAFDLGGSTYLPDFYLPRRNEWHEVKGRLTEKARAKLDRFRHMYPHERLVIIGRDEIKRIRAALAEVTDNGQRPFGLHASQDELAIG